jgi:hypothetical protein
MRLTPTACVLLILVPGICLSEGLYRCGSSLVSADSSVADLLKKCGKPSSQVATSQDVYSSTHVKVGTTTIETWRYDRGTTAPPMTVTIVDGTIQSIDDGR